MDTPFPRDPRTTPPAEVVQDESRLAALAGMLAGDPHPDTLERQLLAVATHAQGAGFRRAHLLVWSPERERLEGWRSAVAAPGHSLAEALERARRGVSEPQEAESTRAVRAIAAAPSALDRPVAAAWEGGSPETGAPDQEAWPWRDAACLGALPLRRGTERYALLVGEWDAGSAAEGTVALGWLGAIAEAAIAAHDRAAESRRRARYGAALAELARASVSAINLAEALHLVARLAEQCTESRGCALWLCDPRGGLRLEVTRGHASSRERLGRGLQTLATRVAERQKPLVLDRVTDEALLSPEIAAQLASLAVLPVIAYGRPLGVLAVYDRAAFHPAERSGFDRLDLECLSTLADMTALLLDQAQRVDALGASERRGHELRARVRREERLAGLGEIAMRAAREARNPVASIGAFARRVHRELSEGDPRRELIEIVIREADRLDRIVREQLDYAALDGPRLRIESLNGVLQEALQHAGETLVRRRVRLLKRLAPDLPPLLLDPDRIRQVLTNVLDNALEGIAVGGRIRVESRRVGAYAVVEVAHDGPSDPGRLLEQLFVPFASSRAGGSGLGMGVAQQIIRNHGGEIRVRSEAEWSTILSFTLPIQENQDRRRSGPERRRPRGDRRARLSEA
ncbi:MAG: hypothetical protein A2W00_14780 [Candidatus Eisenbacteria bacterium RBG_16_71_46]|nr:MAG: hypothetical protein A2W00_14780 [Candidatus Eisenbacteria bacterium RBG_16_71_46]